MNQLELAGISALVMGAGFVAGGTLIENWDSADDKKKRANQEIGYSVKMGGIVSAAAGAALWGVGALLGDDAQLASGIALDALSQSSIGF